jgi:hypothetical protein
LGEKPHAKFYNVARRYKNILSKREEKKILNFCPKTYPSRHKPGVSPGREREHDLATSDHLVPV